MKRVLIAAVLGIALSTAPIFLLDLQPAFAGRDPELAILECVSDSMTEEAFDNPAKKQELHEKCKHDFFNPKPVSVIDVILKVTVVLFSIALIFGTYISMLWAGSAVIDMGTGSGG